MKGAFGQGTGPILLNEVTCTGMEQNIAFCQHNDWYLNDCKHSEDVGVFCDSGAVFNSAIIVIL